MIFCIWCFGSFAGVEFSEAFGGMLVGGSFNVMAAFLTDDIEDMYSFAQAFTAGGLAAYSAYSANKTMGYLASGKKIKGSSRKMLDYSLQNLASNFAYGGEDFFTRDKLQTPLLTSVISGGLQGWNQLELMGDIENSFFDIEALYITGSFALYCLQHFNRYQGSSYFWSKKSGTYLTKSLLNNTFRNGEF